MLLEKTQRRLCRLLFCLGCVAPTIALTGWSAARVHPAYNQALVAWASEEIGLRVECDRLQTPRPGVYRLEGVRLSDPQTFAGVGECGRLQLRRCDDGWRFSADRLQVAKGQFLPTVRKLAERGLLGEGEVGLLELEGAFSLTSVRCGLGGNEKQLTIRAEEGFELELSSTAPHSVRLAVESNQRPLPCDWLPCPPLDGAAMGSVCFLGRFETSLSDDRYANHGRFVGTLALGRVDHDAASWNRGSCRVRELKWTGPRVDRFDARLELRDGSLARRLVLGMNHSLLCDSFPALGEHFEDASQTGPIPFSQLACEIEFDEKGLSLGAGCGVIDGDLRGGRLAYAVLQHDGTALLKEPSQRVLPAASLVRALWHGMEAELPASVAAQSFASRLPHSRAD